MPDSPHQRLRKRLEEIERENKLRIEKTEYSDSGIYVPDAHDTVHEDLPFLLPLARQALVMREALAICETESHQTHKGDEFTEVNDQLRTIHLCSSRALESFDSMVQEYFPDEKP